MNKEKLVQNISHLKEKVTYIISNIDFEDSLLTFQNEIKLCDKFLSTILNDLNSNVIPEKFYSKLFNYLAPINVDRIYDKLKINLESIQLELSNEISALTFNTKNLFTSYNFFKNLNFISNNLVVVGANGSGKSTLASNLKSTINERVGIVIPAQKLLIMPTFDNTPNFKSTQSEYNKYQSTYTDGKITYNASKTDDIPYADTKKYGSEYKFVLKTLLAERGYIRNQFCSKYEKDENINKSDLFSKLDKAIDIWNILIEHRELFCDDNNELLIKDKSTQQVYQSHKMSDGEKNILYLIGRVLLANKDAMIIVDEPEMYLHKVIVNKLWDKLENDRNDCIFVYLTHDLDFASTRKATKAWIKEYIFPNKWEIKSIPENTIPESLLMKLLGSRKTILFCEGRNNSLDFQIMEILFPNYTITPVSSCRDVINYVKSFNKISNKNTIAIGLIDRDYREDIQIEKLKSENIYSHNVAEIENLFISESFIKRYSEAKKENIDIKFIKDKVINLLSNHKELQISNYVSSYINYKFSESHMKKGNTKNNVIENLNLFTEDINIDKLYSEREIIIDNIIANSDYERAIRLYNNKGVLSSMEDALKLKPNTYRFKALEFLKIDEEAKKILISELPIIE